VPFVRPLAIHYACAERWPLVTTGGLGEVAYAYPLALARRGHRVTVLLPGYGGLPGLAAFRSGPKTQDPALEAYAWREAVIDGLRHLFFVGPVFAPTEGGPYTDASGRVRPDLNRRFALFSQACAERAREDGAEILHLNDWHTAPAAALLAHATPRPGTVLTVHNFRYRGETSSAELDALFPSLRLRGIEGEDPPTFLGVGVRAADAVQTVSPTYAREVLAASDALARHLRARPDGLAGILNGLDTERWNPRRDPALSKNYGLREVDRKRELRRELAERWSFPLPDDPLAVFVGRLIHDKGIDLLIALLPELEGLELNLAILGRGDPHYESILRDPPYTSGRHRVRLTYDDDEAHRLLAAADLLLMPSRHEPCGLVQFEALRYGTIPIVQAVGGLRDSVRDVRRDPSGNGFVCTEASPEALLETVRAARRFLGSETLWRGLVRRAMSQDHGWRRRMPAYEALYRRILRA
jgi:starch synthase